MIRRKGAEGSLPLPAEDKIEILMLLAAGAELRQKALETLRGMAPADVLRVVASPQTAPEVLHFAAEHLLPEREELREALLWNPGLPAATRELVGATTPSRPPAVQPLPPAVPQIEIEPPAKTAPKPDDEHSAVELLAKLAAGANAEGLAASEAEAPPEVTRDGVLTDKDRLTLIQKINAMTVVEKIKAALTGNMETRAILIRDSNKIIPRAVLQSPKVSDSEVEGYAAAKNVSEEVLRLIATNRKFIKTYVVMRALVNNPRAPINITLPLLPRLNDRDLKGVSLNRNVPEVIRTLAVKTIKQKEEASKPKVPGRKH